MQSDTPLSVTLIEALADVDDVDPCNYDPLYTVVNPEHLDGLFRPTAPNTTRPHGQVSFPFAGYHITIDADGTITIRTRR